MCDECISKLLVNLQKNNLSLTLCIRDSNKVLENVFMFNVQIRMTIYNQNNNTYNVIVTQVDVLLHKTTDILKGNAKR